MNKFPIIEALKKYKAHFNSNQFISLPSNSPFGNLNLSWVEIVIRIECVNELIVSLYVDFENLQIQNKKTHWMTLDQPYKQKFQTEQIFYWLRKTSDELISLVYLLSHLKNNKKFPEKIGISSIGEFLKTKNAFNGDLDKFKKILITVNEISNGYKHSFINSQIHAYEGLDYPVVFAYTLQYNDLTKQPKFHSLNLRDVLNDYDFFLNQMKEYITLSFVNQ